MVTTAEQVARAVLQNSPSAASPACPCRRVPEKDAREAGQLMIVRDVFFLDRRVCQICGHTENLLVSGKAP
jgi:hypothetical protein